MQRLIATLTAVAALLAPTLGHALLISDLDLNSLSFEANFSGGSPTSASGTSNGIGWTVSVPGTFWAAGSNTTSSQSYNDLPGSYDDVHLGNHFTLTFDEGITHLLVALANGQASDGPNFGIAPVDVIDINVTGTQLDLADAAGGLALFEFGAPVTTLVHTNTNILDGWDMSFFAYQSNASVPLPAPALLLLLGLFYRIHQKPIQLRHRL